MLFGSPHRPETPRVAGLGEEPADDLGPLELEVGGDLAEDRGECADAEGWVIRDRHMVLAPFLRGQP